MRSLAAFALACVLPISLACGQTTAPPQAVPDTHTMMPGFRGEPHSVHGNPTQHMDKAPVPPSKSLNITVQGHTTTLTLDDLLNLPQTTVHVHNAHSNQDEDYTGPLLADVLTRAGLTSTKETEPLILHSTVVATGTDHYFVLYSAAEVEPAFSRSQVIVAVMKSGLPDTAGGLIQLINTDGAKPARWVHGLANLNVVSMTPQP